jgi:hypothetical protein
MKNNPPTFEGGYDPEGAYKWLKGVEKVFKAMGCLEDNKVVLGVFVLHEEANYWWNNASQRLELVVL